MKKPKPLYIVLGVVAVLVVVFTIFAMFQMHNSSKYIAKQVAVFEEIGQTTDVEGCADAVLDWVKNCKAVKGLCKASVGRLMSTCLMAKERVEFCKTMGSLVKDSHYGFKRCSERGYTKRNKECASVYSTVGAYCLHVYGLAKAGDP
jgi:hypothetical protein